MVASENDPVTQARSKLIRIFQYLQALNALRNPVQRQIADQPWVLWLEALPEHPCIEMGQMSTPSDAEHESDGETEADADFILRVSRPEPHDPPLPPVEIADWLQKGWQDIDGAVEVKATRNGTGQEGQPSEIRWEDDPDRPRLLSEWLTKRDAWATSEKPARAALSVFERLYNLQAWIERESERLDLLVGDGILHWPRADGKEIHHPILLQRLTLSFDAAVPEFVLTETSDPPELYSAALTGIPDIRPEALARTRSDLESNFFHPLGGATTTSFLRQFVNQLPGGRFVEEGRPTATANAPRLGRSPVIFVRHRSLGFTTILQSIIEDLRRPTDLPSAVARITGIDPSGRFEETTWERPEPLAAVNGEDEHVLLSKQANLEQLEIARRLAKYDSVLVQGPPGTGKTHAIANLLGHVLAQGKSVLVTSHTAKALKVLREKVVEPLQPLCVSVLDDSAQQMEAAVKGISERLSSSDVDDLERQAARLDGARRQLLAQLREVREQLRRARRSEYDSLVVAGEEISPSEAARQVAAQESMHEWLPSPVTPGAPMPLTVGELADLYRSNSIVTVDDEREITAGVPDPRQLIAPDEFAELVNLRSQSTGENLELRRDLWAPNADGSDPLLLGNVLEGLPDVSESLVSAPRWKLAAIAAGREGGAHRGQWEALVERIEEVFQEAAQTKTLLTQHGPEIPVDCLPGRLEEVLDQIIAHLTGGGKLGTMALLVNRDWKRVLETARVSGHRPSLPQHFAALRALTSLRSARATLVAWWERQVTSLGGPSPEELGLEPESRCRQLCGPIRECLGWYSDRLGPLRDTLIEQGFQWDKFIGEMPLPLEDHGELLRLREALQRLPDHVCAQRKRLEWIQVHLRIREAAAKVASTGAGESEAAVLAKLRSAFRTLEPNSYQQAHDRLVDLRARSAELLKRRELLNKLEQSAPGWAGAIRNRQGLHGRSDLPGDVTQAWRWRQLHDELERRAQLSMEELQQRMVGLSESLRQATTELVEKKAWAAQVRRTTLTQRMALVGWLQHVLKAKGRRAPRLLAEARKLMPQCQSAVPVWIMPLSRVVETYHPTRNRFDVVVIDEASQADVMALAALYLGRQVIVVGDDKQVSPEAVGLDLDELQNLIDTHLQGIPNKDLYDGRTSIYDLAQRSFEGNIMLKEHFRCVTPIIQFSNHHWYKDIKPLRDASSNPRQPHTVAHRVEGATAGDKVNEREAREVASLLLACTEQPEYERATFGVISLVGDEQAMRIDTLLHRLMPASDYAQRKVLCGNSAQFQGDERDVVFLSMVDVGKDSGPLPLRSDERFQKRFNVAASRGADQMWVVYSLDPSTDLQPEDLRSQLIQHAKDPEALMRLFEAESSRTQSEFEIRVLERLVQAGYLVKAQWRVGAYSIDFVVEGAGKRLAVECDGDRWHPPEKLSDDMGRQLILERMGWKFVRIRGSVFFRDPDKAMEPVFARLEQLGVPPVAAECSEPATDVMAEELRERIVRRAAELRNEWDSMGEELWASARTPSAEGRGHWRQRRSQSKPTAPVKRESEKQTQPAKPIAAPPVEVAEPEAHPLAAIKRPEIAPVPRHVVPQPSGKQSLKDLLIQRNLEVVDKTPSGGALWVVGGAELSSVMSELKTLGHRFIFAKNGGKATKNRPAWFAK